MELMIASEIKVHQQGKVNSTFAMQSVIQAMLLDWQSEIILFKNKAVAIIDFMSLGYLSDKCFNGKKAYFKRELLQFVHEDFPHFQNKISEQINKWASNRVAHENTFGLELEGYQKTQEEWQELKRKFWQLEIQIMEGLLQNYPVRII